MWNTLNRYVLIVGILFHIVGTVFFTGVILDGNKYLLQIIQYTSLSKSVIIFNHWIGDDRYKFKYYFLYFILNFTALIFSGVFIKVIISPNVKNVMFLTLVIFLIGFVLTLVNAFLYQYFKLKSYKYN